MHDLMYSGPPTLPKNFNSLNLKLATAVAAEKCLFHTVPVVGSFEHQNSSFRENQELSRDVRYSTVTIVQAEIVVVKDRLILTILRKFHTSYHLVMSSAVLLDHFKAKILLLVKWSPTKTFCVNIEIIMPTKMNNFTKCSYWKR